MKVPSRKLQKLKTWLPIPVGILILLLLASCSHAGNENSFCLIANPILVGDGDELTPETAREILEHNRIGHAVCGW